MPSHVDTSVVSQQLRLLLDERRHLSSLLHGAGNICKSFVLAASSAHASPWFAPLPLQVSESDSQGELRYERL